MEIIYVYLIGEGTDVWRPVEAEKLGGNRYRILLNSKVPEGEEWQFSPGEVVRCEQSTFSDGEAGLKAVERVEAGI